jgi:hypothetical protein
MAGKGRCADRQDGTLGPRPYTSFISAWQEGLSPHEAVADAKIRSNAQRSPRWRMRWKQAIYDVNGCRPGWAAIAGGGKYSSNGMT